jgi:hypothetical protein
VPVRPSVGLSLSLVCALATVACGKQPLDEGATGSSGGTGVAGAAGSGGRGGASGAAGAPARAPTVHRPSADSCPIMTPTIAPSPCEMSGTGSCRSHGDCTDGKDGRCVQSLPFARCSCTYDACFADGDCPGGAVCACSGSYSGNACVSGSCHVDADCGAGGYCSPAIEHCTGVVLGYFCRTAKDSCGDDADCGVDAHCNARDPGTGAWRCQSPDGCPL